MEMNDNYSGTEKLITQVTKKPSVWDDLANTFKWVNVFNPGDINKVIFTVTE